MTASAPGGPAVAAPAAQTLGPAAGAYLYCIGQANGLEGLKALGFGAQRVSTVSRDGLAAFVSDHPVGKLPISRENMIVHQRVMEEAMSLGTILPVRFSTISEPKDGKAPEERIVEKVLKARRGELNALLEDMQGKVELGVKAVWTDLEAIFREIAQRDPRVRKLRARIQAGASLAQQEKVALGEAVRDALLAKKQVEGDRLLAPLKRIAVDHKLNKTFGDRMLLNAAFLVTRAKEGEFDRAVEELARLNGGRMLLRYVGPVPACNFVEIVVSWD